MARNRRAKIHDYYSVKPEHRLLWEMFQRSAAGASKFAFTGASMTEAVVVRTDLNGYSSWARDRPIEDRAALLDEFFSSVIPVLDRSGGVFFRDEGDCIIGLFAAYFGELNHELAEKFALTIVKERYGKAELSAKSCIACGEVAIYQKNHETGSEDWSAEGEPFVRAARLEQAVSSGPKVVYYRDDYQQFFTSTNTGPAVAGTPQWSKKDEKLQVAGLGLIGGWTDVVVLEPPSTLDPSIRQLLLEALREMK